MKMIFLLVILTLFTTLGQTRAVTSEGREVILYDNGTWEYASNETTSESDPQIPINTKPFRRLKENSFELKSTRVNVCVWLNPLKWSFTRGGDDDASEYKFQRKKEDLYAMMISEEVEIPLLTLREIALSNAKSAAPDAKITFEEYRTVNGIKVLCLQMKGTISGMKFIYYGYYYTNESGTVQLITYTTQALFDEYKTDMEDFLNGFSLKSN